MDLKDDFRFGSAVIMSHKDDTMDKIYLKKLKFNSLEKLGEFE